MRILMIADCVPFPPIGGGRLRVFHLVRALAKRHEVTLIGFTYDLQPERPPAPMEVVGVPWDYRETAPGEPSFACWTASRQLLEVVQEVTKARFDLAIIECSYMARVLAVLPKDLPKVMDFHDVYALGASRAVAGTAGEARDHALREYEETAAYERRAVEQCVCCLVISEPEADAARSLLAASRVEIIPNGVETSAFVPIDDKSGTQQILFTGTMDYSSNIEAVEYFTSEVLPLVRRRVPGAEFHIVGARPTEQVLALASDGIVVDGSVADVRPYFRSAKVVVVPVLHGAGLRIKILEAAACGKAIVSTTVGAEGLNFVERRDIVIADATPEFAESVIRLLKDDVRRRRLGRCARQAVLAYDWGSITARYLSVLESLI